MKLTGEILAKSLNAIVKDRKIATIKDVMKAAWDEQHQIDIPEFLKDEKDTFEYQFNKVYLPPLLNGWHFHETYNWALEQEMLLKVGRH